jgi:homoserine dehydrogenase
MFQTGASHVGRHPVTFNNTNPGNPWPLRLVLLGAGTVGGGVLEHLRRLRHVFEIQGVCVRNAGRHPAVPRPWICESEASALDRPFDVLVDATGDVDLGLRAGTVALAAGRQFVTTNKFLAAGFGPELEAVAARGNGRFLYSAAVGGAAPFLEGIRRLALHGSIVKIQGILNGTTNYVIDRVAEGASLPEAVAAAQEAGFAERDATDDLSGRDAASKLVLLVHAATGIWVGTDCVRCETLSDRDVERARQAAGRNKRLRQLSTARIGDGRIELSVRLVAVDADSVPGRCLDEWNCVSVRSEDGARRVLRGRGAGRWPTAGSVMADLLELAGVGCTPEPAELPIVSPKLEFVAGVHQPAPVLLPEAG